MRGGFFLIFGIALAQGSPVFLVDSFSGQAEPGGLPRGWKPLFFKKISRHTEYGLEKEGENYFVKAVSSASASAIYKEVPIELKDYPLLSWRWKIDHVLAKADARRKNGDDYPARIYVAFAYDPARAKAWERAKYGLAKALYGSYPPEAALNYVWDNKLPIGAALDNAYTERAKMIVVESGPGKAGEWVREERDAYADYKKIFGREPPKIAFIALMTDTDNTGESAIAYYDDIAFSAAGETKGGVKK